MKKCVFLLGGAGNVFFQLVEANKASGGKPFYANSLFVSKVMRRVFSHTDHPSIHNQIFHINSGGWLFIPFLFVDIFIAKLFHFSLFTVFDINSVYIRKSPLISDLIYFGYFQKGVDVVEVARVKHLIRVQEDGINSVVVHYRGGDFKQTSDQFTSPLPLEYYKNAADDISSLQAPIVVTNDILQARHRLGGLFSPKTDYQSNDPLTDFSVLKSAEIMVCSNSTFAFMAALTGAHMKKLYIPKFFQDKFSGFESLDFEVVFI